MLSLEPLTYHRPQQPDPRQRIWTRWCQVSSKVYQMVAILSEWHFMTCYNQHFWLNNSITCPATFWPSKSIKQLIQGQLKYKYNQMQYLIPPPAKKLTASRLPKTLPLGRPSLFVFPLWPSWLFFFALQAPVPSDQGPTPSMPPPKNEARHNKGREQEK